MKQLLSAGQVRRILGNASGEELPHRTLCHWCSNGLVTPLVDRGGHGNHRVFGIVEILCIAIGRALTSAGFKLEVAGQVMRTVGAFSEEHLLSEFAKKRTCIAFLGTHVYQKLLTVPQSREFCEEFSRLHPEMFRVTGLRPQAIDIGQVHSNIQRVIQQDEERREKVTA